MPNVLETAPARALAQRAGKKIGDARIAGRFERLALDRIFADARNFRPASPAELESAPDWARRAQARGETMHVVRLHRTSAARVHAVARRLADTCRLAATTNRTTEGETALVRAACVFLDKFDRVNFDVAAKKALYFSRGLEAWEAECDSELRCPEQHIPSMQGCVWQRIPSLAALKAVGREFQNCLAHTGRRAGYGGMLMNGAAQFWVLRDVNGAGLIVAMAPTKAPKRFTEVRGPRNALISPDHADLARLAAALGVPPREPPPVAPPIAPTPAPNIGFLLSRPSRGSDEDLIRLRRLLARWIFEASLSQRVRPQ